MKEKNGVQPVSKEYLKGEIETQNENYKKLLEQKASVDNAVQQTIGVLKTLDVMLTKMNGKEAKGTDG